MAEKILVIGGVAAGTKAAAKLKRENPKAEIGIVTKDEYISYAGCGLPYYIGGVIEEKHELVVKTPEDFKAVTGIDVLTKHEAVTINKEEKNVTVKDLTTRETKCFEYDQLIIATGASPFVPPIEGKDLKGVFSVRTVSDALKIRELVDQGEVKKAVIVGGGFIGLEVAENLHERNIEVALVELIDHILPPFDEEIALYAQNYMQEQGVNIYTGEKVLSLAGDAKVTKVITDQRELEADLVIMSVGVRPNVNLAKEIGIEIGTTGAIKVNEYMETNIKDIYAVGDCAENVNLVTGKPAWYPMGSTANKMGRVAGINMANEEKDGLKGVLGTTVVKLFKMNAAKTGLSERDAKEAGFEVETALVPANDKAHYYPGYREIITKLVVDKNTHKVLGAQVIGEGVVDKPIDIVATAITFGAKVEDLQKIDLAYAPPFSMAMSSTILAASVLTNKLTGRVKGIGPIECKNRLNEIQVVDVRDEASFMIGTIPGAVNIPSGALYMRANELDQTKETVLVCKIGKNAYLSYLKLKELGFKNVRILEGGMNAYPFERE
ncbi:FAD-dependent oxidoreductase [Crassaminicella profunda]|uniref:FAD-dependent oxidoreductase n=1 Tax=Crassaminicella profunda TaxID=1286698 RepID=UPI001CA6109C|nr:FAD-dependent oxidoreductase [Crassaminicella profunda]QZY55360.1 FAD-dependent oxidoreductase [Crassaminicella profunda]